jgi:hypothetical protein
MMEVNENVIRDRLSHVLNERDTRLAVLIVQSFKNSMDMLDQQSPATIEALLAFARDMQKPDSPALKSRHGVRAALIQYAEHALAESRKRERRLLYGLTGVEDDPDAPNIAD